MSSHKVQKELAIQKEIAALREKKLAQGGEEAKGAEKASAASPKKKALKSPKKKTATKGDALKKKLASSFKAQILSGKLQVNVGGARPTEESRAGRLDDDEQPGASCQDWAGSASGTIEPSE
jgi:hypothetical protein